MLIEILINTLYFFKFLIETFLNGLFFGLGFITSILILLIIIIKIAVEPKIEEIKKIREKN